MSGIDAILQCPTCTAPLTSELKCGTCGANFDQISGVPVLIDFSKSIVTLEAARTLAPDETIAKAGRIGPFLARLAYHAPSAMMPAFFKALSVEHAQQGEIENRILVIGGGTLGPGEEILAQDLRYSVIRTDIYVGHNIDVVCDGHDLPFTDASFDAVICQAVLEHVLDPQRVVDEIHRVLRPAGLVAAGTPFMQQVHMDAYDFTRFTLSGHRWLFRHFDELAAGTRGGPGLSTIWSIGMLARSMRLGTKGAAILTAGFSWLKLLDGIALPKLREDGANGVWFVGRRADTVMTPHDIVRYYEDRRVLDP